MDTVKRLLKEAFGSKKFLAFLAGIIVLVLSKVGADIAEDTVLTVLGWIGVYILGQGVADAGKEKAKVLAAAEKDVLEAAKSISRPTSP